MSRSVTLEKMIDRVRVRAEVLSEKWTQAIVTDLLNEAVTDCLDLILSKNPTYSLRSRDLAIVTGVQYVNLPGDFYKLYGVRVHDTDNIYKPIFKFVLEDESVSGQQVSSRTDLRYSEYGAQLRFHAPPGWSDSAGLRVYFIPTPPKLVNLGDTWDGVFGWDDYAVWNVVVQIIGAEERDPTVASQMLSLAIERIKLRAVSRDLMQPPRMRDGRGIPVRSLPRP